MADKENLTVEGYLFNTSEDARLAVTENEKAEYFSGKIDINNGSSMLAVYDKLLDSNYFKTPVGWDFLKNLQTSLRKAGVDDNYIRPIPVFTKFAFKTSEELENSQVKERVRPSERKKVKLSGLQISVICNVLLFILVAAMFAITIKSENPNVINYKMAITNKYASWEQELEEREAAVREKENELNIIPADKNGITENQ